MTKNIIRFIALITMALVIGFKVVPSMLILANSYYGLITKTGMVDVNRTIMHTIVMSIVIYSFSSLIKDVVTAIVIDKPKNIKVHSASKTF